MRAIVVGQLGGPEQLQITDLESPWPGPGEIRVDVEVAGVNFMDTGARRLGAATGRLPFVPGVEGAGRVSLLGEGVTEFAVGDRVAWVYAYGSYAEQLVLPAESAVPVPDEVSDELAAAVMLQGITAHHFVTAAAPVEPGQTVLVHAAAGGVGQKITQLAAARGAKVIGVTSTAAKAGVAKEAGADDVVVSTGGDFVDQVLALTDGQGVHLVCDGGGETTFRASMRVLRPHGTLLYYGAFIGDVPVVKMNELPHSIRVCYPVFRDHIATRADLLEHTADLFRLVATGQLQVEISRRYPLEEAAQAHRDIESRATTGKLLLLT